MAQAREIRRAVPADAERLTEVARRAKAHWGYPASWLATWRADLTLLPAYVEANRVYAAEIEGAIHGFCALEDRGSHWTLEHLWVDPAHHGGGAGRALVRHALSRAHEVRPGMVRVVSDPMAAGFYARLGAVRVGSIRAPMAGAPERELPVFEMPTASARATQPTPGPNDRAL